MILIPRPEHGPEHRLRSQPLTGSKDARPIGRSPHSADVAQLVEQLPCKRGQRSRFSQKPSSPAGFSPSLVYGIVYVRPLWEGERAQ